VAAQHVRAPPACAAAAYGCAALAQHGARSGPTAASSHSSAERERPIYVPARDTCCRCQAQGDGSSGCLTSGAWGGGRQGTSGSSRSPAAAVLHVAPGSPLTAARTRRRRLRGSPGCGATPAACSSEAGRQARRQQGVVSIGRVSPPPNMRARQLRAAGRCHSLTLPWPAPRRSGSSGTPAAAAATSG
jgi:hypothetical protein